MQRGKTDGTRQTFCSSGFAACRLGALMKVSTLCLVSSVSRCQLNTHRQASVFGSQIETSSLTCILSNCSCFVSSPLRSSFSCSSFATSSTVCRPRWIRSATALPTSWIRRSISRCSSEAPTMTCDNKAAVVKGTSNAEVMIVRAASTMTLPCEF